jgi:hypothetical protein
MAAAALLLTSVLLMLILRRFVCHRWSREAAPVAPVGRLVGPRVSLATGPGRPLAMTRRRTGAREHADPGVQPQRAAAGRFSALSVSAQRAWLASHWAALRAGRITLAQIP